jgi:hypothetical protein
MALFFNLKTLEEQSCNDTKKFLNMLYYHWNKSAPLTKYNINLRSKVSLAGTSYLLNPGDFFADKSTDDLFRVQYIKLAGRRDWNLYKQYKYRALNTSFFPDLIYDSIKHNPLLVITNKEIKFKYEG